MKNFFFNRTIITCSILLLALQAVARQTTLVKATADRTTILIGEPITIRLEADIPEQEPIRFFYTDSIPHFEFLSKAKIDTTNTGTGTRLSQLVQLTSFDSGTWVIPPFVLREGVQTDSFQVEVGFTPFDANKPYNDIKDIIEAEPEKEKEQPWWWYLAGGGVLIAVLLYFVFRKRKPVQTQMPAITRDYYQEAKDQLAELERRRPETKLYYAALADIFRNYTQAKHGIFSLQQTTDELIPQLKALRMPEELFNPLNTALRLSDWVKFAKYKPEQAEDQKTLQTISAAIDWLETNNAHAV